MSGHGLINNNLDAEHEYHVRLKRHERNAAIAG